jgi:hypothetical protein
MKQIDVIELDDDDEVAVSNHKQISSEIVENLTP